VTALREKFGCVLCSVFEGVSRLTPEAGVDVVCWFVFFVGVVGVLLCGLGLVTVALLWSWCGGDLLQVPRIKNPTAVEKATVGHRSVQFATRLPHSVI